MVILIIIYWTSARQQIINEFETTHRYSMTQVMRNIDGKLDTIRLMANQLSYDSDLTPYQLQESQYGRYKAINRLKTYHSHANFLDDMILYIRGDKTLYSSNGVLALEFFTKDKYRYEGNWDAEDFIRFIHDAPNFGFSPKGCFLLSNDAYSDRKVVLTYPWGNNTGRFGTIIGIISANYFEQLLTGIESDIRNAFFILNENGDILFSAQNEVSYTPHQLEEMISASDEGIYRIKTGTGWHSVIILRSEQNNWAYVSTFPQAQFTTRLFHVKTPILVILCMILLVSVIAGVLLAFRNYLPIRRLTDFLGQRLPAKDSAEKRDKDELLEIGRSIQAIVRNSEGMKSQLEESRIIMAEQFLYKIMTQSNYLSLPGYREKQQAFGIELNGPCFCVIVFKPPRKLTIAEIEKAIEEIRLIEWEKPFYCVEMDYMGYLAILFNVTKETEKIREAAQAVQEKLYRAIGLAPILGVGHTYDSPDMISRSFTEAVSAAEATVYGENSTAFFDELKTQRHSSPYWYPPKALLRLMQGLNQGNSSTVNESIAELSELLHTQRLESDALSLRFMISGIIQHIWPIVEKMKLDKGNKAIDEMIHYSSINDFLDHLRTLSAEIIETIENRTRKEQGKLFESIISYIEQHYMDQNLSLKSLASRFDMTDSYLSRFFSNNSGMNFIDFLTEKRMAEASRLLCETDMRVRDIMEKVGYIDLASFTRKFKQLFGTSPGQFRAERRKNA